MGQTQKPMPHFLKDFCEWLPPDNDFTQKNQRKKSMLKSRLDVLPCRWMKKKILAVQQEKNGAEYERSKLEPESETLHLNTLWRTRISAF